MAHKNGWNGKLLSVEEAIQAIQEGTPVEVPYTTRKGCRGLARRVETEGYWITLSVSEKPTQAWLEHVIDEALQEGE